MGATKKDRRINAVLSVLLTILCIAWMYPVFMILMNSLKTERAITTSHAFAAERRDLRRPEKLHLWHSGNGLFVLFLV